ncbi:GCN5-related N-acetyltransferase [Xylanimonas cellulosilytica DSM 15894]|uniref:GCN5-related N-acetyltransferase n=1 Tax=Xylanimonas cellulosilytica (strain DSM 15894 / JCM 12276 / CECT 5975 / KCTC 9989 / LMG 20990 / NBRC 107835 / XIL07) TaxID=446471 RepID=D1BXZ8_XYLCX|nr:GNAT family N-acetyltransferase [Xylanimonas cellulosilytica]ACZ31789.1 GCN5-related N-acetyltransferase [Xylanimonas cellulosilytica DSM 15894]
MHQEKRVLRGDTPEAHALLADGWSVIARSWGAGLLAADVDGERFRSAAAGGIPGLTLRELTADDVAAVLTLDAATANDYPGDIATAHAPLTPRSATPGAARRAWGAFVDGELVAMTFVDVDGAHHAETDFTVVAAARRRRGLGTAVKAASIATLVRDGVTTLRTGGSAENAGSLAANRSLGYVVDEEWWTLAAPVPETHAS